jgi:hypothetical protein
MIFLLRAISLVVEDERKPFRARPPAEFFTK